MSDDVNLSDLFDGIVPLPDPAALRRYGGLVGLEDVQTRLHKEAEILVQPALLDKWALEHHGGELPLVEILRERPPLFIFGGDVGTGKTTLAETFGDRVARELKISITLMRLSLNARGSGTVGEMTSLITKAFAAVETEAPSGDAAPTSAVVLLIDEADALAQSRAENQMHHEDRAGVNALIRGIDSIASGRRAVVTVLCTNRLSALDPAIRRRAFDEFEFKRPDQAQRVAVLTKLLEGTGIAKSEIEELAAHAGQNGDRDYGVTYSDITGRWASAILLDAFPDGPLAFSRVVELTKELKATPPFSENGSG
ncbi:MAG: AAA family ATPase [Thermoleophilaceae bacterium]